jgi:glucokinase
MVNEGKDRVIRRIFSVIHELKVLCPTNSLKGIGIGSAGIIDIEKGMIVTSPNFPGWQDVPLRDLICQEFDMPTILDNDANAAVFGEHWAGAGQGSTSLIGLTLGTGVGGGIILNGSLWHGSEGMAGEIGHMTIVPDGINCSCGNTGCLEAYASATAIVRRTADRISQSPQSNLLQLSGIENPIEMTAAKIYQAALSGDALAQDIFYETGAYLGLAIGSLINILNPEIFIIGGGVSKAWNFFYKSMMEEIHKRVFNRQAGRIKVVAGNLGDDAGLIGAGCLAAQTLGF